MSTGSDKPGAGAQGPAQVRQKSKNEKDAGTARNSGESGGADAQVGAASAAFLGVLPVFSRADTMQDPKADAAPGALVEENATPALPADDGEGLAGAAKEALSPDDAPFAGAPRPETAGSAGSEPLSLAPFLVSSGAPSSAGSGAAGDISAQSVIDTPAFDTAAAIDAGVGAAASSALTQEPAQESTTPAPDNQTGTEDTGAMRGQNQQAEPSAKTFFIEDGFGDKTVVGGEVVSDVDVIDLSSLSMPVTVTYTGDEAGTITNGLNTITFSEVEQLILTDFADVVDGRLDSAGMHIDAGAGDDVITGGTGADTLVGAAGDDLIEGFSGDDEITSGAGADTIRYADGSFGNDTVFAGDSGADQDVVDFSGLSGPVTVDYTSDGAGTITDGTDTVTFSEVERLVLSDDADVVTTSGTTAGIDVAAGAGDDVLTGTNLGTGHDTLDGGLGDDAISGEAGNDLIEGGAGDDTLRGGDGRDTLLAGDDDDLLIAGSNDDSLDGGAGDDTLRGESGNNTLSGGDGNDRIEAGVDADTISGGVGADTVIFGSDFGSSDVTGGEGGVDADVIDLSGVSGPVTVTYTADEAGTVTDGTDTISFSEVEHVVLSDAADVVDAADAVTGVDIAAGGGEDTVVGGDGDDLLSGGRGDDTITGGAGDDVIDGGDGADTAQYSGDLADFAITYDGATDTFTITDQTLDADLGTDTVTGVETFVFDDGTLTAAELQTEAGRQANSAPTDIAMSGGSIQETVADGGTITAAFDPSGKIVATLTTTDSDAGDSHSFDLVSDVSGKFEIVGNEIRVRTAQEIDFETDTSFDLTVRTSDQYGETHEEVLTINVIDFGGSHTAGDSSETVTGSSEEDVVTGGLGNDVLDGGEGADRLEGGAGNDTLSGGAGDDTLRGDDGADTFRVADGFGTDQMTGGEGGDDKDVIDLSQLSGPVTVSYSGDEEGTITDGSDTITFSEVERLILTDAADYVDGSDDDTGLDIASGGGNDTIFGTDQEDQIDPGAREDVLYTGADDDTVETGEGSDTIHLHAIDRGRSNILTDSGTSGTDKIILEASGSSNDTFSIEGTFSLAQGFEVIDGSGVTGEYLETKDSNANFDFSDMTLIGVDLINGTNRDDTITGSAGDDNIAGEQGDDLLSGGDGQDTLNGGSGDDTIDGGAGDDRLTGGKGDDVLTGGTTALSTSPLIRMEFEDGASGVATDISGNGHNGIYQGDATAGGTGWDGTGTSLVLDGSGDYVEIPDSSDFDLAEGTVSLRFNADSLGDRTLFSRDSTWNDDGGHIFVRLNADGSVSMRLQSDTTSDWVETAANVVSADQWHHLAASFGPDGMRLYVDGVEVGSDSYTGGIGGNDEPWTIGANQLKSGDAVADNLKEFFDGQIDEFLVFGDQLSGSDIATLNTSGPDAFAGNDTAVYSGDIGDFTIVYDAAADVFTITDTQTGDGLDEGTDTVSGITNFEFNGVTYTAADLQAYAANTAPTGITFASGGSVNETVSDGGSVAATFDPSGTTVATLATTDGDAGDTHSYTLIDDPSGKFEVVGNAIRVRAGQQIDYETDTQFDLTLRTTDALGQAHEEVLTLNVVDFEATYAAGDSGETITGTSEEDTLSGGAGLDTIYGGDGDDVINGQVGGPDKSDDTIFGGDGNDTITVGDGTTWSDDYLDGGAGDDYIVSTGSMDTIYGGEGDDTISAGLGLDSVFGGDGNDSIYGGSGHDEIHGDAGDDWIDAGTGDDWIDGGDGNDAFFVAAMQGNDTVEGGAGSPWADTLQLDGMGAGVSNFSGSTVDGDGWTMVLDGGHAITSLNSGVLELSSDASGVVTFDDGGTVTFADLERVTW